MATKKKTTATSKATEVKANITKKAAEAVNAVEAKTEEVKETIAKEVKAVETKAATKRACKKVNIELQYADKCIDISSLEAKAVAAWAEATGNAKTAAKNINLYVKPEENMVYYVIEGDNGYIEL